MGQNDDSFTAFDNAIGFANAFRLLFSKTNVTALMQSLSAKDASMAMPTVVNGAFACELFLKALLKAPPSKGKEAHSLVSLLNLYDQEQPGKRDYIMKVCVQTMQSSSKNVEYNEDTFLKDLQTMDKAFMQLRYWHEPEQVGADQTFNLGFLDVLITVLEHECCIVHGKSIFQM